MVREHPRQTRKSLKAGHIRPWYINPVCYEILAETSAEVRRVLEIYRKEDSMLYGRFMQAPGRLGNFIEAIEERLEQTDSIPAQDLVTLGSKIFGNVKTFKLAGTIGRIINKMHSTNRRLLEYLGTIDQQLHEKLMQNPTALILFDRSLKALYQNDRTRFSTLEANSQGLIDIAKRALSKSKRK